jgi:hypothetical protein
MLFLMIDGKGDPSAQDFQLAVEALYSVAFTLKFWSKKHAAPAGYFEYSMAPLEALWWFEGYGDMFTPDIPRSEWQWTAMIRQPEFVSEGLIKEVAEEVAKKKPNPKLASARLEEFEEGCAVQIMHIGPYSAEWDNIRKMHDFMAANGYVSAGKHHEVYLGDPRRTAPEKLRTVLRHPVTKLA